MREDRAAALALGRVLHSLEGRVVAFLGEDVLAGLHGDVGDFDRRVASALAVAFGEGWTGLVVAVCGVENGRLVWGSAKAIGQGRVEESWLNALQGMGFSEVVR